MELRAFLSLFTTKGQDRVLQRCLLTSVPLARPADVAFFLASYAREALTRLEERATLPALSLLRQGMEKALGVAFDSKDGEHLFRSTLVQTLFYGVFSAWVAHSRTGGAHFDWRAAQWSMTVPVARFLFAQAATPEALQPLELVPLLDAAAETLNRVDKNEFFAAFSDAQAVQYFYEPFLEYFDPVLRRQLGVWYTPPEIVGYMVERVDRILRTELGRADGLADPDVWVLDPCCGTGSYIVEVLARIRRTLDARGLGDAAAERLKQAATTRVVGFEIMTAPFTIAHWQVGETLRRAGAPLAEGERAAVYLTNALTGWETAEDAGSLETIFETLAQERAAAITVKQNRPILVVLGNPPYNAFAGVSPESEGGLVEPYKEGLQDKWHVRKFNLDDLYVRFYRIAERRIAERTGQGIICFISNYSWLSYSSFVVMRERLLWEFDTIWIDNLNGDSRETGKLTPAGDPDPSVFSTEINREGIRLGTCVATLVRRASHKARAAQYRAFWGVNKRAELLASLDADSKEFISSYVPLAPTPQNRYLLRPGGSAASYPKWAGLNEISRAADWSGVLEKRRGALMAHDEQELRERMARYCDPNIPFEQLRRTGVGPVFDAGRFDATRARAALLQAGGLNAGRFARIMLYPFDQRWCFHTNMRPLWNEPRPELAAQQKAGNLFLVTRARARRPDEGFPCFVTAALPGDHLLDPNAHPFPFVLHVAGNEGEGLGIDGAVAPNLSKAALRYCAALELPSNAETSRIVWHHALAIAYSPAWVAENGDGIRQGWPRVPLPHSADLLRASAEIGERVAALLDPQTAVPVVTAGAPRPELASIAVPTTARGAERDWRLTAGWGSRSQRGITMPGRGRADARPFTEAEHAAACSVLLGATTRDVWMNGASYWRNVPEKVWELSIGGKRNVSAIIAGG